MKFYHGTSERTLARIGEEGILPPDRSGVTRENRRNNHDRVFLLDGDQPHSALMAAGYALRAALEDDSSPIILSIDGRGIEATLERSGNNRHFDQYTASHIPLDAITAEARPPVAISSENMVQITSTTKPGKP